ncbi:MAG: RnfABCDGE type electron transport complex subunit B [Legionella sp.]|nr:RnfABCDGE type electron transport complex subunit B [Legionella sp.]
MPCLKEIDALLPQTQCRECGYPGCLPYAQALAQGQTTINKCPPGGEEVLQALGTLLNKDPTPYLEELQQINRLPSIAYIRESECIGCTKCIAACPVDAIIGSRQLMHAILVHECTGCGLCVEPCPVDCIEMHPQPESQFDKQLARTRHQEKKVRLLRDEHAAQQQYRKKRQLVLQKDNVQEIQAKQDYIQQALARVQAKLKRE